MKVDLGLGTQLGAEAVRDRTTRDEWHRTCHATLLVAVPFRAILFLWLWLRDVWEG